MGTPWTEIICNYAMPVMDDVRLIDQMGENPALFFRRMALYMDLAIPMVSRPPELDSYLNYELVKPVYDDMIWRSTSESLEGETTVETTMTGYDLFSCSLREVDESGVVTSTPVSSVTYDPETGTIVFPQQETVGLEYNVDFYTDGSFYYDLTEAQKRLLGLAVGVVWDERFSRNWLNITQKIKDASFDTVNESNYMREVQNRLFMNRHLLNDELRKYEQDVAYKNTVTPKTQLRW
jgi:hypothetical protein